MCAFFSPQFPAAKERSKQVSRSDKTLLEAIIGGLIPKPKLMRWNAFQTWRSQDKGGPGLRPTMAIDGSSTTNREEHDMYREVMAALYGEDWSFKVDELPQGGAVTEAVTA